MAYSTQTNIENVFGVSNVALWSQLDPTSETADTTRIALAIANADEQIDDRFRGSRYLLPLSPVTNRITDWSAKLAGVWLYQSRGARSVQDAAQADNVSGHMQAVHEEIDTYLAGQRTLNVAVDSRGSTAPRVVPR